MEDLDKRGCFFLSSNTSYLHLKGQSGFQLNLLQKLGQRRFATNQLALMRTRTAKLISDDL